MLKTKEWCVQFLRPITGNLEMPRKATAQLTFLAVFNGFAVGGASSSGTVRFLVFVRAAADVDRVAREAVPGPGGG